MDRDHISAIGWVLLLCNLLGCIFLATVIFRWTAGAILFGILYLSSVCVSLGVIE